MTRRYSSPSLADAAKQLRMLSISCERCNRFGRYRIDKLIEKYGPDITLPELRHELAQCRAAAESRSVRITTGKLETRGDPDQSEGGPARHEGD